MAVKEWIDCETCHRSCWVRPGEKMCKLCSQLHGPSGKARMYCRAAVGMFIGVFMMGWSAGFHCARMLPQPTADLGEPEREDGGR